MTGRTSAEMSSFHRFATSLVASLVGLGGVGVAAYATVQEPSLLPLGVAMAILAGLEALLVYAARRR